MHDLVDFVSLESERAGKAAAQFCTYGEPDGEGTVLLEAGDGVGYTVPQKIRPAGVDKVVDIFFRVRQVYKNVNIVIRSGGTLIAKYGREHMAPGEMEKITLPLSLLSKVEGGAAVVSIERGEAQ